jgi:hypothetical protein
MGAQTRFYETRRNTRESYSEAYSTQHITQRKRRKHQDNARTRSPSLTSAGPERFHHFGDDRARDNAIPIKHNRLPISQRSGCSGAAARAVRVDVNLIDDRHEVLIQSSYAGVQATALQPATFCAVILARREGSNWTCALWR